MSNSENTQPKIKGFADLGDLSEDARIDLIGRFAMTGQVAGFVVENDEKADRYLRKMEARFRVRELDRGPFAGQVFVRVERVES